MTYRNVAASLLGAALLVSSTAYAAVDPVKKAIELLGSAVPTIQAQMVSMSQGCSGGSNGVPPVSWGALQIHGYGAVNELHAGQMSLQGGQIPDGVQHIKTGLSEYDALINGLALSCSGGAHGENPVSYGNYVEFRNNLKTELNTIIQFLQ
jgi:hypothetical protein